MGKLRASNVLVKAFFEKHPADAARSLEALPHDEARTILQTLPIESASAALEFMNPHAASLIFDEFAPAQAKPFLEQISPKRAADILLDFHQDRRVEFLSALEPVQAQALAALLMYPPETAGGMMTPGVTALNKDLTVGEATRLLRSMGKKKQFYYVYVTDAENRLQGVLGMRELLLADTHTSLESIMSKEVVSVPAQMDREEVVKFASQHQYLAVPVVDAENRLLGMIQSQDLVEAAEEEATEDIQKMFGAGGDEQALSPVPFSMKKRLPWLLVNLGTAFLAAAVVGLFENTIARITALAVFLPVVAGQGGNTGVQSLAVVIRGLALGEVEKGRVARVFLKEASLGILNGLIVGIVTAAVGYAWQQNPVFGLVIGFAMIVNMFIASVAGAGIPLLMRSLGWDPAQSSSIILTTVTDVMGFFSFLGLATLFQHLLT